MREVRLEPQTVVVHLALRRRRLRCPECAYATRYRYDRRQVDSSWRHLDFGGRSEGPAAAVGSSGGRTD